MKYNIDDIKSEFDREGYRLLSTEHKWNRKLEYICPYGHKWSIMWDKWRHGRRCPYCYGNKKFNIDYIRSEFSKEGYILLSNNYYNSRAKLKYICPEGHRNSIRWNHWKSANARCPTCYAIKLSLFNRGHKHPNWKGGISYEPYCDVWADKEFKEYIKARDDYMCKNPDCWRTSKRLCIHHINYNKKDCHPINLITLCKSCNARANFNRHYWKRLYKDINASNKHVNAWKR